MYRADKLYNDMMAVDTAIKQLKVEDEASLAEYFRLYTELIFNHKWIGSIYDIYSDNADIYRENGLYLHGAHEMMKDTLKLTSAFPDMQVTTRDTFAVKRDDGYKLWRYYTMSGTNKTYSIQQAPQLRCLHRHEYGDGEEDQRQMADRQGVHHVQHR